MITTLDIAMLTFMKKLSKEQIEKRNRVKQYLLRSLHVITYVLSALFIIVCIVVGVQSCKQKKESNVINKNFDNNLSLRDSSIIDDFIGVYELKYNTGDSLSYSILHAPCVYFGFDDGTPGDKNQVLRTMQGLYYFDNGEFIQINTIYYEMYCFQRVPNSPGDYVLVNVSFYDDNNIRVGYVSGEYNSQNDSIEVSFSSYFKLIFNKSYINDDYFNKCWVETFCNYIPFGAYSYSFNDIWNYNSLFQYQSALPSNYGAQTITENINYYQYHEYNGYLTYSVDNNSYVLTYQLPYFMSGGYLFDSIVVYFDALADGEKVQTLNNGLMSNHKVNGINTTVVYNRMAYKNSNLNFNITVNIRNGGLDSNHTYIWYLGTTWTNQDFKDLVFVDALNPYEELLFSNINNVQNSYGGGYADLGNVFTLISSAFAGLTSILSISIMPSITLGVLLFIPLVVLIIITIFKLVKK